MSFTVNGMRVIHSKCVRRLHPNLMVPKDQHVYVSYSKKRGDWQVLSHDSRYPQKQLLIKEEWLLNNCNVNVVDTFLTTSIDKVSCIYVFELGKVKDRRTQYDIVNHYQDDDILVKYGMTNDLKRRTHEHVKKYGNDIKLKYHINVDVRHLRDAEKDIDMFFKRANWHVKHERYNELAVIPLHLIDTLVHHHLKTVSDIYNARV